MFDFKLTKKGDLDLDYADCVGRPQKVSFVVAKQDAQRISYLVTPLKPPEWKTAQQRISFRYGTGFETKFTDNSLQDNDELVQAVMLALRTEENDVYNSNVGTKLYQLRHKVIHTEDELSALADSIGQVVNEILPGATVKLVECEYPDAGFFRYESYVIEIHYNGKKLLDYILL